MLELYSRCSNVLQPLTVLVWRQMIDDYFIPIIKCMVIKKNSHLCVQILFYRSNVTFQ